MDGRRVLCSLQTTDLTVRSIITVNSKFSTELTFEKVYQWMGGGYFAHTATHCNTLSISGWEAGTLLTVVRGRAEFDSKGGHIMQCVAVCCRVLQSVAECCRVLQCVAVWCCVLQCGAVCCCVLLYVAVFMLSILIYLYVFV